ncbi:cell wall-binding repeat-containing protein [Bifidobacterium adolescentis]|uniref:cell wall-binding repeat-containing protein n=1 Tax=Bifidobacterium adolescentis TaxID=1680 RepID=UPI0018DB3EB3|nr:cell wall-binding repeat-containing protein [Bifidobacterium adolescentis]MBH8622332.1 cell wall-binding repeat-containing protein [Bifidobacterium adolescentis]
MISPKSLMKIATTASAVAMTVSVAVVPAYAMQDIAIEDTPSSFAATVDDAQNSSNSMPDNPNATLPETVSENISDDSTVVSENLAVTPEGDVQNIETGETVTDAQLVGTQSQQPDPLAKTDGESFIPVSASDVKDAVEQPVKQSAEQSSLKGGSTVRLTKFESNEYGAHWGTYNGTKAFFDYRNNLFAQQAKGVIDVSSWQGDIDWAKAKADGVEGAIIRLGFGWGNDADTKAQRNISECKRLGIPFGIYWYSYAEDAGGAKHEGSDVVSKLRQMGVSPNDLKYPVYYDLERWTWTGHTPPTDPNVYNGIVNAWYGALQSSGYQNLGVYSYTSYLQGPLNNANIYAKTRWVAQYGPRMEFTAFGTNDRGWQYTSSGQINGISGNVDMSAFGNKTYSVIKRLAGSTRYDTMVSVVSEGAWSAGGTVIVASGENYPDALSASGLAGVYGAPIVLTEGNKLSPQATEQIRSLRPSRIIVVGGLSVISGNVLVSLQGICSKVSRIAGATRTDTSSALYRDGGNAWGSTAIVVSAANYPDALSVSPYAYAEKAPVFLCDPVIGLTDEQRVALKNFKRVLVVGGENAVPSRFVQDLPGVIRRAGATRYETSMAVADWGLSNGLREDAIVYAAGLNFPDALTAGPLAGRNGSVLLLVDSSSNSTVSYSVKFRGKTTKAWIVGGTSAVSQMTANRIADNLSMQ